MLRTPQRPTSLAVLTSGGDAAGMNAAVRAVVRAGLDANLTVYTVYEGFQGLVDGGNRIKRATSESVGGILQQGGTVLGTARCQDFRTLEGRRKAAKNLVELGVDALVVIGGDGSLTGANLFKEEWRDHLKALVELGEVDKELADAHRRLTLVGMVGSIDNDMFGTDMTIGADTALHRITEALDAIHSTASSHQRAFVIEVMGRSSGYIALMGGLAGGAELVLMPEKPESLAEIVREVKTGIETGKRHSILCVAEGFQPTEGVPKGVSAGKAIAAHLEADAGIETRLTVLGHLQRGGSPSAFDRILACRLGHAAVTWCGEGRTGEMAGLVGQEIVPIPFERLEDPCMNVDRAIHGLAQAVAN